MYTVSLFSSGKINSPFISPEYLPPGKDEYYLRNIQNPPEGHSWRKLTVNERESLIAGGNLAEDWDRILVSPPFDPLRVQGNRFYGTVRIGEIHDAVLQHHDLRIPTGIYNSLIIDCDIGDDTTIYNVHYLSRFIIGCRCIIKDVDEMSTTDHAKFGNGIIKQGEPEDNRISLDIMNETGSRAILPFDGIITADAYLWAKYRDDDALQSRLKTITQERFDESRGYYGIVEDQCVIKSSRILKDVRIGSHCYIKGANKLKNLTVNSSEDEPSQIGEGVELVNGIIGYGCHIFYGCKAVRFIIGNNSSLKYGARLIHSFLGDNSTVSCCEVLNNLIFPAHEQHHNNSFLVAALVMGQSNLAAGATVGSNHNSRANDNEIQAGRGFWPGLCTSLKHSSRFASFTLIAKGAYPAEIDQPLPFSLLNNNESQGVLELMPAFWWLYNMYALTRNSWKFHNRDKRLRKVQHIEFDSLAPDTVEEILQARTLLEFWTGKAALMHRGTDPKNASFESVKNEGRSILTDSAPLPRGITVFGEGIEKTNRKTVIIKPREGYGAYNDMLLYYAVTNLLAFFEADPKHTLDSMKKTLSGDRCSRWVNFGGQLIRTQDEEMLRRDITSGTLPDWDAIHRRYDDLWISYELEKKKHAYAILRILLNTDDPSPEEVVRIFRQAKDIQVFIRDQVYLSRKKDFENPFRRTTYRNMEEMTAAIGTVDDNSFISQVSKETDDFCTRIDTVIRDVLKGR